MDQLNIDETCYFSYLQDSNEFINTLYLFYKLCIMQRISSNKNLYKQDGLCGYRIGYMYILAQENEKLQDKKIQVHLFKCQEKGGGGSALEI